MLWGNNPLYMGAHMPPGKSPLDACVTYVDKHVHRLCTTCVSAVDNLWITQVIRSEYLDIAYDVTLALGLLTVKNSGFHSLDHAESH
jgi:hypothetical protein